jgi:hypothetical protein
LNSVSRIYYDEVIGKYYGGRYYLSFADNYAGLSYNHKLLVMQFNDDFSQFGFTVDNANIACFVPAFGVGDFGQAYAGTSNEGQMLRLETRTADIIHDSSTDINSGTLTRLVESGTEEYPIFNLDPDGFTGLFSNTLINDLTGTVNSYSTDADIIDNVGFITSDILYSGASALYKAFWTVSKGANGDSAFRIRTGDSAASCATATWSEWFTDNTGADISGVTARDYIQYQVRLSSDDLPDANTKIYRDNFIVKISSGLGSPFEDYINFIVDTGKIDLGAKDRIKRLRSICIEYETSGTTLNIYLAKDDDEPGLLEAVNTDTHENIRNINLPFNYIGEFARLKIVEESLNAVKIKSIRIRFSLLPINAQTLLRGV